MKIDSSRESLMRVRAHDPDKDDIPTYHQDINTNML